MLWLQAIVALILAAERQAAAAGGDGRDTVTRELQAFADADDDDEEGEEDETAALALLQRIFECDPRDLAAVKALKVEAFSESTSAWADAEITRLSIADTSVDIRYVDEEGNPAPQRGRWEVRYDEKAVPVADGGKFRCKAVCQVASLLTLTRSASFGGSAGTPRERARPRPEAPMETLLLAPKTRRGSALQSVPEPPSDLRTSGLVAEDSVAVSWQCPPNYLNADERVTGCELDWSGGWYVGRWNTESVGYAVTDGGNTWRQTLVRDSLRPNSKLALRVRARNAQGWSKWSATEYATLGSLGSIGSTGSLGSAGSEDPDVLLATQLARSFSVASITRVECVLGTGVDEDSAVGMEVEYFDHHGRGWVPGTIASKVISSLPSPRFMGPF